MLRLIDERSAAFRATILSASDLDAPVPTCPEWTLSDLARHLGKVHRFWADVVSAGPADAPPASTATQEAETAPREREALVAWSAASTQRLLDALRDAGSDRGCWTWWGTSDSPQTSGAVARHQVQEAMVHTYDAQITTGTAEPLPELAAVDGVDEFLSTCCAGTDPWPFKPATVEYHITEGGSWRLSVSADGTRITRLPAPETIPADATTRSTAAELVLVVYGRLPIETLQIDGDKRLLEQLRDWDPDA
jgi:uncharacterized protein (TIGR03083 family)